MWSDFLWLAATLSVSECDWLFNAQAPAMHDAEIAAFAGFTLTGGTGNDTNFLKLHFYTFPMLFELL